MAPGAPSHQPGVALKPGFDMTSQPATVCQPEGPVEYRIGGQVRRPDLAASSDGQLRRTCREVNFGGQLSGNMCLCSRRTTFVVARSRVGIDELTILGVRRRAESPHPRDQVEHAS